MLVDPQWLAAHGLQASRLAGVLPMSGVFDLEAGLDDTETGGVDHYITPPFGTDTATLRAASPIDLVAPTTVPLLVVLGDDYVAMQDQSRCFVAALQGQGLTPGFVRVPGRDHFALLTEVGSPGDTTADVVAGFVRRPR